MNGLYGEIACSGVSRYCAQGFRQRLVYFRGIRFHGRAIIINVGQKERFSREVIGKRIRRPRLGHEPGSTALRTHPKG